MQPDLVRRDASRIGVVDCEPSQSTLRISTLKGVEQIEQVVPAWLRLWESQRPRFPCTHPMWVTAWYRTFAATVDPRLVVAESRQELVALAPMVHLPARFGAFPAGALMFAAEETADYCEILAANSSCRERLVCELVRSAGPATIFFQNVRVGSPTDSAILNSAARPEVVQTIEAPFIDLHPLRERGVDLSISRNRRQQMRKKLRRLNESGVEFRVLGSADPHDWEAFAVRSASLQAEGLEAKGIRSDFRDAQTLRFYSGLLRSMSALGMLRVFCAFARDQLVAFRVGMVEDGVLYDWITAFDLKFAKLSPGSVLLYKMISDCVDRGLSEVDMMQGNEAYKHQWTRAVREVRTYAVRP